MGGRLFLDGWVDRSPTCRPGSSGLPAAEFLVEVVKGRLGGGIAIQGGQPKGLAGGVGLREPPEVAEPVPERGLDPDRPWLGLPPSPDRVLGLRLDLGDSGVAGRASTRRPSIRTNFSPPGAVHQAASRLEVSVRLS
jgi:hypothetical protein